MEMMVARRQGGDVHGSRVVFAAPDLLGLSMWSESSRPEDGYVWGYLVPAEVFVERLLCARPHAGCGSCMCGP